MKRIHENKYYQVHTGRDSTDTEMFDTLEEAKTRRSVITLAMLKSGYEPAKMSIYLHNTVRIIEDKTLITEVKTITLVD